MSNVYTLHPGRFPVDTKACLLKLLSHAEADAGRPITGIAFVAFIDDTGFIADACGQAKAQPAETLKLLPYLEAKLRRLASRRPA